MLKNNAMASQGTTVSETDIFLIFNLIPNHAFLEKKKYNNNNSDHTMHFARY